MSGVTNHIRRKPGRSLRPVAALKKIIRSRAAGPNDALAAEAIQLDVSLACYAAVEVIAAIGRPAGRSGVIRQKQSRLVTRGRRLGIRKFNVEGRHACSGSRRRRPRARMQGFGWITDMPPSPAAPACRHRRALSLPIAIRWRRGLFLGCEDVRPGSYATPITAFAAADHSSSDEPEPRVRATRPRFPSPPPP